MSHRPTSLTGQLHSKWSHKTLLPGEYVQNYAEFLEEQGVKKNQVFKGNYLDHYGYHEIVQEAGFTEHTNPNNSWFGAFSQMKAAGILL
ncbi:hypothetical protein PROFUN_11700 [Planoprotostelium fungivorum]|uniref:Uncharacterized protein n=1 Tax=Planoprotostelium fungivorum TaxID=1890364 RepID=A0A2P6N933_9EUKA|nr:hypothetical protein PROFUN_11700 [Planoprotostelium fungivorum]